MIFFRKKRELALGIKFKRQIGKKYFSEKEISLLVGELVGKRNGFRKRDVYKTFRREKFIKHFWVVLKERLFYILSSL